MTRRQTDKQTIRQTDKQTNRQTDKVLNHDGQKYKEINRPRDKETNRQKFRVVTAKTKTRQTYSIKISQKGFLILKNGCNNSLEAFLYVKNSSGARKGE